MIKGMKSYVRTILGEETLDNFNDFEKGIVYMERSRLDQQLPSKQEFEMALEFAKNGLDGLVDFSGPRFAKQVAKLSIELLEIQLEIIDKRPDEINWTYKKSFEVVRSDEDLCNRMDFLASKLYQIMPLYSKEIEQEYIKEWMAR